MLEAHLASRLPGHQVPLSVDEIATLHLAKSLAQSSQFVLGSTLYSRHWELEVLEKSSVSWQIVEKGAIMIPKG
jgi:hypothetical protein